MGTDLKQRIIDSVQGAWSTISAFAQAHRTTPEDVVEREVDQVMSQLAHDDDELCKLLFDSHIAISGLVADL